MKIVPLTYRQACEFVTTIHRHHKAPQGHKFSIGLSCNGKLVGVVMVGRPVARLLDNGLTLEVTRLCTDGVRNGCSMLYSAAWRAAKAMGYEKLITYILATEPGTSLKAAGWKMVGECGGGTWNRSGRSRTDKHPIERKIRFEIF